MVTESVSHLTRGRQSEGAIVPVDAKETNDKDTKSMKKLRTITKNQNKWLSSKTFTVSWLVAF